MKLPRFPFSAPVTSSNATYAPEPSTAVPAASICPLLAALRSPWNCLSRNSRPKGPPALSSCGCCVTFTSNVPRAVMVVSLCLDSPSLTSARTRTASPARINTKNITSCFMVSSNLANHLNLVDNSEPDATYIEETRHAMTHHKTDPPRGVLKTAAADRSRYRHERYHPSAALDQYVEHYWVVEWDLRGLAPERAETLPHPSVHMVFERDGGSLIWGAARAKFSRLLEDKGGVFAVKFTPGGFYPFAGVPVSRFSDRTVSLHDVFGAEGDDLDRAVLAESEDLSRITVIEDFLRARRPEPDENVTRVTEIVYAVAKDRGILKAQDLVDRYGVNKRTLQRLFARYVGVSPKWVMQRYRLHEAAGQLAAGASVSQATIALNLGYSDQAHFVRDFKAIVGVSPAAYARAARQG